MKPWVIYAALVLFLVAESFFNLIVLRDNLCSPRHTVTAVSISTLSTLVLLLCISNCICFPCASAVARLLYYALLVILGIAQTAAVLSYCEKPAATWAYGIDGGIVLIILLIFISPSAPSN